MRLYFQGHQERYAVEQLLFTLFPRTRPVYPGGPPSGEDGELFLRLDENTEALSATAELRYDGKRETGASHCPLPPGLGPVELTRLRRRSLQRAFYHAATALLGEEPAWGMLSGVRPVKLPVRAVLGGASLSEAEETLCRDYRVTPQKAKLAIDCAKIALLVRESLQPDEISLYVGIPFCPSRCSYCSFVSAGANTRLIPPYLEALHAEIEAAGRETARKGLRIRSLYIGGGTPTTLSPEELKTLLSTLHHHFDLPPGMELTVEAGRPDSISSAKLQALREGGANRISLNPQTMRDDVLARIGRNHSAEDIRSTWPLLRQAGFSLVNMDVIAGLPGDTLEGFSQSLAEVLALGPENITVHTLARKRGASLQDSAGLPGAFVLTQMLKHAEEALREQGYLPYYLYRQKFSGGSFENVGWTKPGLYSVYNVCVMEELHSVLALGAGGVSKTVDPRAGTVTRSSNPKYPQDYLPRFAPMHG